MGSRRTLLLAGSIVIGGLLALTSPATGVLAQTTTPPAATAPASDATPAAATPQAGATTATVTTTPGTPTPSPTPSMTPTPTATLTGLQSRLVLAKAYLDGRDFDRAAELYSAIAEEDRGNAEALDGLRLALAGRAAIEATIMAPFPTESPIPTAVPETLSSSVRGHLRDIGGAALAAVMVLVGLYFLANLLRWLLSELRELWFTRLLPLLGRPAVPPGYLIGEFTNTLGAAGETAARIVPQALTEKLIAWNQLVADKQIPVEPAPSLQLGPMAWISVLWRWLLPSPRGYHVTGLLLRGAASTYQLAVQRAAIASNSIDLSATFSSASTSADEAFAALAGDAAKWLISPADMAPTGPGTKPIRELGSESSSLTPTLIFDRAMELLLPIRQQVNRGAVDFSSARQRLTEAQALTQRLPSGSPLRQDLEAVLSDLRKSVPG